MKNLTISRLYAKWRRRQDEMKSSLGIPTDESDCDTLSRLEGEIEHTMALDFAEVLTKLRFGIELAEDGTEGEDQLYEILRSAYRDIERLAPEASAKKAA